MAFHFIITTVSSVINYLLLYSVDTLISSLAVKAHFQTLQIRKLEMKNGGIRDLARHLFENARLQLEWFYIARLKDTDKRDLMTHFRHFKVDQKFPRPLIAVILHP